MLLHSSLNAVLQSNLFSLLRPLLLKPLSDTILVDGFFGYIPFSFIPALSHHGDQHACGFIPLGILVAQELSAGLWDCLMHPHAFDTLAWVVVSEFSIAVEA